MKKCTYERRILYMILDICQCFLYMRFLYMYKSVPQKMYMYRNQTCDEGENLHIVMSFISVQYTTDFATVYLHFGLGGPRTWQEPPYRLGSIAGHSMNAEQFGCVEVLAATSRHATECPPINTRQ